MDPLCYTQKSAAVLRTLCSGVVSHWCQVALTYSIHESSCSERKPGCFLHVHEVAGKSSDEQFLMRLAYLSNMFGKLNKLNPQLHGRDKHLPYPADKMWGRRLDQRNTEPLRIWVNWMKPVILEPPQWFHVLGSTFLPREGSFKNTSQTTVLSMIGWEIHSM